MKPTADQIKEWRARARGLYREVGGHADAVRWDTAFAELAYAAGAAQQREADLRLCEERSRTERGAFDDGEVVYPHPGYVSDILAAAIRAQQEAK
jgi:hypothetical protein